jgi:hypothetical protein
MTPATLEEIETEVTPTAAKTTSAKKPATKTAAVKKSVSKATTKSAPVPQKPAEPKAEESKTAEVSKSMISKVKRGFKKAGKTATDAEVIAFANSLVVAGVKILSKSSSRIARCIKGQIEIKDLCG